MSLQSRSTSAAVPKPTGYMNTFVIIVALLTGGFDCMRSTTVFI
jgi:hypothetical protein